MSKIPGSDIFAQLDDETRGVGEESMSIRETERQLLEHYQEPLSRQWNQPQQRFLSLKKRWIQETEMLSSTTEICTNVNYQQIIGMGEIALPFIFADLSNELQHWFWALRCITGVDPIPEDTRGNLDEMRKIWLKWGRNEGFCG